jgi:hypothetical protein
LCFFFLLTNKRAKLNLSSSLSSSCSSFKSITSLQLLNNSSSLSRLNAKNKNNNNNQLNERITNADDNYTQRKTTTSQLIKDKKYLSKSNIDILNYKLSNRSQPTVSDFNLSLPITTKSANTTLATVTNNAKTSNERKLARGRNISSSGQTTSFLTTNHNKFIQNTSAKSNFFLI